MGSVGFAAIKTREAIMTGLFIFFHSVCAILLITAILMQSGRGGGLTESFASAESMFGARTNEFMVRATMILAGVFLVTSLTLAHLSSKKERSLLADSIRSGQQNFPSQKQLPSKTEVGTEAAAPVKADASVKVDAPVKADVAVDAPAVSLPTNKM